MHTTTQVASSLLYDGVRASAPREQATDFCCVPSSVSANSKPQLPGEELSPLSGSSPPLPASHTPPARAVNGTAPRGCLGRVLVPLGYEGRICLQKENGCESCRAPKWGTGGQDQEPVAITTPAVSGT